MKKPTRAAVERSDDTRLHYEGPGIDTRRTLFSAAVVVATVVISCVVSREIYSGMVRPSIDRSSSPLYGEGLVLPTEPRLEGIEMMNATRAATSAVDEDRLQKYGWADREKKTVRIPIQKAMDLAIEQRWLRSTAPRSDDRPKHTDNAIPTEQGTSAP